MKRDIQYIRVWQTKPILEQLFRTSENGKLRRKCKHHLAQMTPFFEDCLNEAKDIMADLGIEGDKMPFDNEDFLGRFEDFLLSTEEMINYEMFGFPEDLMEFADGINGDQELVISWLFDENQPSAQEEELDGRQSE